MAGVLARSESAPYLTRRPVLTERMARRRLRRMVGSLTNGALTPEESVLWDVDACDIEREWRDAGGYYFETDDDGMLYIAYGDGSDGPDIPHLGIRLRPEQIAALPVAG